MQTRPLQLQSERGRGQTAEAERSCSTQGCLREAETIKISECVLPKLIICLLSYHGCCHHARELRL